MPKIIYIAGPMTGMEDNNYPAFFEAEARLKSGGYIVLNPAWLPQGLTQGAYMAIHLAMVQQASAVCVLPGWGKSEVAIVETHYAMKVGKRVVHYTSMDLEDTCNA